jgi:hypothetical protein
MLFMKDYQSNSHAGFCSRRGKYSHNFRKTAGTKIEISPLRYMTETSGFFSLYTHL